MHKISWTGPRLFVIVGQNDNPIYEHSFVTQKDSAYMSQFILHAALDLVDESQWKNSNTFIKAVDKYNVRGACFVLFFVFLLFFVFSSNASL
jgi:hypothetical protein